MKRNVNCPRNKKKRKINDCTKNNKRARKEELIESEKEGFSCFSFVKNKHHKI